MKLPPSVRAHVRAAVLVATATLAGCLNPDGPEAAGPEATGNLGVREADPGDALSFRVGQPEAGVRYFWSFGDGESALGAETSHAYETPGRYPVALQTVRDGETTPVATGWVVVTQDLDLEGVASQRRGPSEVPFEVHENATAIDLAFTAQGSASDLANVMLVDPTGRPQLSHALRVDGEVEETLRFPDPMRGEWLLVVEPGDGRLEWEAEGEIDYAPPGA